MTTVTQPQFLRIDRGHLPGADRLPHDRNSMVGMIDNSPTTIKIENFVMKAWLWK